jgi:hypothetical protein
VAMAYAINVPKMPGMTAVTMASLRLFSKPARNCPPIMMPSTIFPGARIVVMLAHVSLPAFDRNAKLMMTAVGMRSATVTYSRNGATGAPVRIDRTSAPDVNFFSLPSPLSPEGERLVSVVKADMVMNEWLDQPAAIAAAQLASTVDVAVVTCAMVGNVKAPFGAGGSFDKKPWLTDLFAVIAANSIGRA